MSLICRDGSPWLRDDPGDAGATTLCGVIGSPAASALVHPVGRCAPVLRSQRAPESAAQQLALRRSLKSSNSSHVPSRIAMTWRSPSLVVPPSTGASSGIGSGVALVARREVLDRDEWLVRRDDDGRNAVERGLPDVRVEEIAADGLDLAMIGPPAPRPP
jgi:hypothetical protein